MMLIWHLVETADGIKFFMFTFLTGDINQTIHTWYVCGWIP